MPPRGAHSPPGGNSPELTKILKTEIQGGATPTFSYARSLYFNLNVVDTFLFLVITLLFVEFSSFISFSDGILMMSVCLRIVWFVGRFLGLLRSYCKTRERAL